MGAVLPMLAYGNLDQQDWCSLNTNDCIQFIQLAQHGLQFLLQELASIHAKLVRHTRCILNFVSACGQCLSKSLYAQPRGTAIWVTQVDFRTAAVFSASVGTPQAELQLLFMSNLPVQHAEYLTALADRHFMCSVQLSARYTSKGALVKGCISTVAPVSVS